MKLFGTLITRSGLALLILMSIVGQSVAQRGNPNEGPIRISGIVLEVANGDSQQEESAERRRGGERPGLPAGTPLTGANVALLSAADSSLVMGTISGQNGLFNLQPVRDGSYLLAVTYVGYTTQILPVTIEGRSIPRMVIRLEEGPQMLDELRISALIPRVEVRGDTTAFNADAYQVNPDASAQDLIRRMPGFTIEDGRIQAQGEDVRRVLVDGEEFFGDDATLALNNLPAEIIGSIEVFDRRSDQARFTGFDDGNEERTVNIVTRSGRQNGQFGRGAISGGTDTRYMASGNANFFNGSRRISLLGMTNNVNQQNFSGDDLEGIAAASQQGGRGGGGGGRWGGGGATRNFTTGSQRGINTTHSMGLNYIDRLNEGRTRMNASYFFNAGDNNTNQFINRQFTTEADAGQEYREQANSDSRNFNHRINGRIEHEINERNSLIFTPSANIRSTGSEQDQSGRTLQSGNDLNSLISSFNADNISYNVNNSALWRHRFETQGRTVSVNLRTSVNNRDGSQLQLSTSEFFPDDPLLDDVVRIVNDQSTETIARSYSLSTDIQYTETLREGLQLLVRIRPDVDLSNSERNVFDRDADGQYTDLNALLTNRFESRTWSTQTGAGLRYRSGEFNVNGNLNFEYTNISGEQTFPFIAETNSTFRNVVGNVGMRYRFNRATNLSVDYRTNTRNPSVSQLQDAVDNSNPLQLRGGNPDLRQQYSHNVTTRFRTANVDAGTSYFGFLRLSVNTNTIGNATLIAARDTVVANGVPLGRGGRFTRPENLGTSWSLSSFFNHSRAVPFIQSNLNLNGGVSYSIQPTLNNNQSTEARNIGLRSGLSLSSNIGPNLDFNFGYRANYNIVDNASAIGINSNFYTGTATARINVIAWNRLVLSSDLNLTHYEGLDETFDASITYWNAAIGYKFLPRNAAEVRLTVFDILAQNNSVNRFVSDGFVDDVRSNVITRFALVTLSYNFRSFSR